MEKEYHEVSISINSAKTSKGIWREEAEHQWIVREEERQEKRKEKEKGREEKNGKKAGKACWRSE